MIKLEKIHFKYPRDGRDFFLSLPMIASSEHNSEHRWKKGNDIHRSIRWKTTHIYWSILIRKL